MIIFPKLMPGEGDYIPRRCFPLDALVSTPEGAHEISDIKHGDIVHAFNRAGEMVEATVIANINYGDALVETVSFDNRETVETFQFEMTPSHRIAAGTDQGRIVWQALSDFEDGDTVLLHDPNGKGLSDVWVLHRGETHETEVCNLITTESNYAVLPYEGTQEMPALPAHSHDDRAYLGITISPELKEGVVRVVAPLIPDLRR